MTNLQLRVVTAVVLISILIVVLFFAPPTVAIGVLSLAMLGAAWEWSGFFPESSVAIRLMFVISVAAASASLVLVVTSGQQVELLLGAGVACWAAALATMFFNLRAFGTGAAALAGFAALVPAWFSLTLLLAHLGGPYLFLWCLAIVAAADTGAYFVGKRFGRRKLAPAISPGKTREGLLGGLVAAALVSGAIAGYVDRSPVLFSIMGLAVGALSVVGDLWVSRFKRAVGLKDSGVLLPGHGGIMDRIDGLVAAMPLFTLIALRTGLMTV